MKQTSDIKKVQAKITSGGWIILWGDVIDEWDAATLAVSIPTGTLDVWVAGQIEVQVEKFSQSFVGVSDEVVTHALNFLKGLMGGKVSGAADIDGLGVKAGIATYHRKLKTSWFGSAPLPNNDQPYIGIRVTKPLPEKEGEAHTLPIETGEPATVPGPA